jgi:hypothetical protein
VSEVFEGGEGCHVEIVFFLKSQWFFGKFAL